jgi:hypothetical protein
MRSSRVQILAMNCSSFASSSLVSSPMTIIKSGVGFMLIKACCTVLVRLLFLGGGESLMRRDVFRCWYGYDEDRL